MTASTGSALAGPPKEALREKLRALGFDEVRFATATAGNTGLREWLEAGRQADMAWLERTADKRMNPDLVLPGAKSVIILGVNYWADSPIQNPQANMENPIWARYALHEDYHDTIKPGLAAAGKLLEEEYGAT